MIPEGTYRARAKSAELGFTKGGHEQIGVLFNLLDHEDNDTGQSITWFGFFTEKTERRTIESLRHCGWTGTDVTDLVGLGTVPVELVIAHETYQDKVQVKVNWVNRIGGGAVKMERPMDDAAKRQFAARMKGLAASVPAATPRAPAAAAPKPATPWHTHPNAPGNDDDMPF